MDRFDSIPPCGSALAAGALVLCVLGAGACADGMDRRPPGPKGGGGELRVVLPAEPSTLNPNVRYDEPGAVVGRSLFNQIVTTDSDGQVIPDLAHDWLVSDDGMTYTFFLGPGVTWHDGRACTSADVRWSLEALSHPRAAAHHLAARIAAIETPDAGTVVVRLVAPWAPFLASLAFYGTYVLPRHVYEGTDWIDHPANHRPIGSGAFRFSEWIPGEAIRLVPNEAWPGRGPYLDRLIFRFAAESAAAADMLLAGEADYLVGRAPEARLPALRAAPHLYFGVTPADSRYYLGFNLRRPPFDDVRLRLAVNAAIDRYALVEEAMGGFGAPALGFYTPSVAWAYNGDARPPAHDLQAARRLIAQARPPRRPLRLIGPAVPPFDAMARLLAAQLAAAGLDVRPELYAFDQYLPVLFDERDFDLALLGGSHGPDPYQLGQRFGSAGAAQFMGYSSAEFDAAVAEGERQTAIPARARAYHRAQVILARDLPAAPLAEGVRLTIYSRHITGLGHVEARGLVDPFDFRLVRVRKP